MKRFACALALFACSTAMAAAAPPPSPPLIVPAGTHLGVALTAPIVSNVAKTGDPFAYTTTADLVVNGIVVVRKGATGAGTVVYAGGAGSHGHEGNLHLRFDTLPSTFGNALPVDVELNVNGHKQRALGLVSGASFLTGFGQAIRGGQAVITPDDQVDLVFSAPECVAAPNGSACPKLTVPPDPAAAGASTVVPAHK